MSMLNVGILGAGRIGAVHAAAVAAHPESRLAAVSDAVAENAARLADAHGAEARGTEEIVADPAIDAVLIATPTDTHSDLVEAATRAGKAVLCEKPLDLSLDRARACMAAAEATGRPVMLGFNRRFDPTFAVLRAALVAGEIGRAELLKITSFDPGPPPLSYNEGSGGLFRDMTIHDFDMARFLMGASPVSVFAAASALVEPVLAETGDVDTAVVTMTYADGRIAVIHNSRRAAYGYDQRIEVLGERGMLDAGNVTESRVRRSGADGIVSARPMHFFLERYAAAYRIEWDAFVRAALDGTPVPVGLADGVAAQAAAEAATRSLATGRPVALADI